MRRTAWGERIKAERVARGWTQRDLADRAQCSPSLVYRLEAGQRHLRDVHKVGLSAAFGLPVAEVFPLDDLLVLTGPAPAVA